MSAAPTLYEPISLGLQCETKFQLCRHRFQREAGRDEPFTAAMAWGADNPWFTTHIFDGQTTPFVSLLEWLRRDFRGVFELEDLIVEKEQPSHRVFATRHPHEFPARDGALTMADIHAAYPAARSRFEHLAAKFRAHLASPGSFLYVLREFRPAADVEALLALLSGPSRHVHLLMVDWEGKDTDAASLPDVSLAWLPKTVNKPAGRQWEGDDAAWDRALSPYWMCPILLESGQIVEREVDLRAG